MTSDEATRTSRQRMVTPGVGMSTHWGCLGCGQRRGMEGSRGRGINKRCAQCIAKKEKKKCEP